MRKGATEWTPGVDLYPFTELEVVDFGGGIT